jgi:hypothetical protein
MQGVYHLTRSSMLSPEHELIQSYRFEESNSNSKPGMAELVRSSRPGPPRRVTRVARERRTLKALVRLGDLFLRGRVLDSLGGDLLVMWQGER